MHFLDKFKKKATETVVNKEKCTEQVTGHVMSVRFDNNVKVAMTVLYAVKGEDYCLAVDPPQEPPRIKIWQEVNVFFNPEKPKEAYVEFFKK